MQTPGAFCACDKPWHSNTQIQSKTQPKIKNEYIAAIQYQLELIKFLYFSITLSYSNINPEKNSNRKIKWENYRIVAGAHLKCDTVLWSLIIINIIKLYNIVHHSKCRINSFYINVPNCFNNKFIKYFLHSFIVVTICVSENVFWDWENSIVGMCKLHENNVSKLFACLHCITIIIIKFLFYLFSFLIWTH